MNYKISYPTSLSEINIDNDNIDICVSCENGDEFTFVIATITNLEHLLENGILDPSIKPLIVDKLTQTNIENIVKLTMQDTKLYSFYGKD